jgi:two-component system response regulator HydG
VGRSPSENRSSGPFAPERGAPEDLAGAEPPQLAGVCSPAMAAVLRRASAIARTSAPVILLGETGTGKEVLARNIHAGSGRSAGPFVPVNCGAIPRELLESEFFGYARGAFSGAVGERVGLFEAASGGTLLLDEIADLPLEMQVKLLRVLQDGEVRRVGSNRRLSVDVRVVAATHKNLDVLVREGTFRQDLYYRLKGFMLRLPPLRDRCEDILPLVSHFLALERDPPRRLCAAVESALLAYDWPGNVREMLNAIRHATALAEGDVILLEHLPEELLAPRSPRPRTSLRTLAEVEREHVVAVLRACGGVRSAAARVLGIARNTLARKLREYGLGAEEAWAADVDAVDAIVRRASGEDPRQVPTAPGAQTGAALAEGGVRELAAPAGLVVVAGGSPGSAQRGRVVEVLPRSQP